MTKAKLMVAISGAVALAFSAGAAWDPGESVTTYWFGPGCPGTNKYALAMTDAWAKQLKEGGFNTVWASTPGELDIAAKYGLRAIYSVDPRTEWAKVDLEPHRVCPHRIRTEPTSRWTGTPKRLANFAGCEPETSQGANPKLRRVRS